MTPKNPTGPYHVALTVTAPTGQQSRLEGDLTLTDLEIEAPVITAAPASQVVRDGETVTLTVEASGSEPLAYQWAVNGATIAGEAGSVLVDVPAEAVNTYQVRVSNAGGDAIAEAAVAVVPAVVAPRIVGQPAGVTITAGQTATLAVQAIGTAPLSFQWYRGAEAAIPGATAPTLEGAPATTAAYWCRVSNAGGAVDSAAATVTVQPNGIPPINGLGLKYRRKIGLPSLWMAYAYGDLTGRVVDGQVRLIFSGDVTQDSPIYEVAIADDQPVATVIQQWWNPYHGKRGTWVTATAARETAAALRQWAIDHADPQSAARARWWDRLAGRLPKSGYTWIDFGTVAVNGTHYYHSGNDLLYIGYGDTYNVAGRTDWQLLALRLHPDGTTEAFGPWRFEVTDGAGVRRQGPYAAGCVREDPRTGQVMTAVPMGSGNTAYPWGANCATGAPWPTPELLAAPEAPNLLLTDRWLYSYCMNGLVDPASGVAAGPIKSARRRRDPYVYEYFPGQTASTQVDPTKYGGVGSWGDNDSLGGIFPLEDRIYFFGGVAGSPIQDPHDCGAAHMWYATGLNNFQCSHGCGSPVQITGPVATARFPWAAVYPWATLEATKNTDRDYVPDPTVESNLEADFGIVTAPIDSVGNAKQNNAGFFNPATRRYYTIAHGADRGEVTFGVINAYLHEWEVL